MAELPTRINLTIVTRERKIVDLPVDEVVLPGTDGELGILPGHTPMLALLKIGQLRYRVGNTMNRMVLSWGFAEVLPDRVIVLGENARLPEEIDPAAANADRLAAEREIADLSSSDPEFALVEARLEQAIVEIDVHHQNLM
jgi:F-type H+-transporting ATPase subunit epsilon